MTDPLAHIPIVGEIKIDLNKAFSMQTIANTIVSSYPKDPTLTVVGIALPIVNVECKGLGIIDPIGDIKDAISKLYNFAMQSVLKPIWDLLHKIMDVLSRVFSFVLDYKLPILGLTIQDLFSPDLYDKVKAKIVEWYTTAKDKIIELLKLLGIPWPLFINLESPEKEIEKILDSIMRSLWAFVLKTITVIVGMIKTALDLWDRIVNQGKTIFGILWEQARDLILGKIFDLIVNPPTIEQIKAWIIEFAKKVLNKAVVTYEEIMKVIKNFEIPGIHLRPFDWDLPLNIHLDLPDIDFQKMLIDIKTWLNNYVISLLKDFVNKILEIIRKIFAIDFSLPVLTIPLTLCAVKNSSA